ncbi:ABC transporter permease [Cohnella sp. REN36]|uniref:ABC transporter permease n=1 Tax=Cohnella sp. REN36 TaxID=2887347 RepID=UPI001D146DC0|nr:ABC transporter permease [Cohnella sp. REN36]MCC3372446.1 ABC transporter permease [Cohnella sp. REN36]
MKALVFSELERLFKNKWTWCLFVCAPILAFISGNYLLDRPESMSAGLFMIEGLQVHLYLMCNIAVAALVAAVFTEEYRGGQLRLLFLRPYARANIFFSKLVVIHIVILALLIVMGISLVVIGLVQFPLEGEKQASLAAILKTIALYYGMAYFTLAGVSCLFSYIALISKNVSFMLGLSVGYVLVALLFDGLYLHAANLFASGSFAHELIAYAFIPYMQYTGLYASLNGEMNSILAAAIILLFYMLVFGWSAYRRFVVEDYLH